MISEEEKSMKYFQHHSTAFTFGILPLFLGTVIDYGALYNQKAGFSISSRTLTYFFSSFPLVGLCFCISFALYSNFEKATETHCHIRNVLPSISIAIGDFYWGRLVWKILIFIHLIPRVLAAFAYAQLFRIPLETVIQSTFRYLTCFLNLLELFCLAVLSAISSKDNHFQHVLAFCLFQIAGMIHGALHIIMYRITGIRNYSIHTRKSYRIKKTSYKWSILFLIVCILLYYRHNTYCEPYVFSAFAFFEYLVVLTNICFHATFRFDFYDLRIFIF
uniref:CWH43-like N-terminal domain-containing protein n=1 Tax=Onchocerca volvulus TaxID=6282 RepID=A0A8R1Y4E2_ONCVO